MTTAHGSGVRRSCSPSRRGFSVIVAISAERSCVRQLAPLGADALQQLLERVGELLHALLLQRLDDIVVVDAGVCEIVQELARRVDLFRQGLLNPAVLLECSNRLL